MTIEFTIRVTAGNKLTNAQDPQLQHIRDHLSEVVERSLRELADDLSAEELPVYELSVDETFTIERASDFQDENAIMELLASRPTLEQILSIRPSSELQARVSELLRRNKEMELSRQEEIELERYLTLEHIVRLAKAYAYEQLAN
jgi:hypothetical protein